MRLDKYLKVSRIIKRRTVANEACDAGRVMANGRPVKASYDVKVGDIIEIQFGQKALKVEVLVVADNVRKDDAPAPTGSSTTGRPSRFAVCPECSIASARAVLSVPSLRQSAAQRAVISAASCGASAITGDAPQASRMFAQSFAEI